jgi:membrane associated rhomboid family serine protease
VVTLIALLILVAIAYRATSAEERVRLAKGLAVHLRRVTPLVAWGEADWRPVQTALRARTPRALIVPALVVLHVVVVGLMLAAPGPAGDPDTLIAFGASFGPRTTTGEWWRLVTTIFVHAGLLHLVVNLIGLVQAGLILERLVGPAAFLVVYVTAGATAALVGLAVHPTGVTVGSAGAVFGVYGLLLATAIGGVRHPAAVPVARAATCRLGPAAAAFVLYSLATAHLPAVAELAALGVGLLCGMVLVGDMAERQPRMTRVATVSGMALVLVVAGAAPLRGIADARPALGEVLAVEDRAVQVYGAAVERFRSGLAGPDVLVEIIETGILPELAAAAALVERLDRVPREHQPWLRAAHEYAQLRADSWRLRAEGLRRRDMRALQEADRVERAALDALATIRPDVAVATAPRD